MNVSLQRKFLLPISIGAVLLILCSAAITHFGLLPELRSQLHKRAELMVITIRAASEINPNYQDLRLALEEITLQTSGVYGITLATLNPTIIWASSVHPDADQDQHTSDMLDLLESSAEQHLFGNFVHANGDVIVITPFKGLKNTLLRKPYVASSTSLPSGLEVTEAYTLKHDDYEGILYLRFNWKEAEALANKDLVNHILAMAAAIFIMLLLATTTVYRVILRPINRITSTIKSQKAGVSDARTYQLPNDEIGLLGNSLNEMLDALNDRDKLLRTVVDHLPVGLSLKGVHGQELIQNSAYRDSYLSPNLQGSTQEDLLNKRESLQHQALTNAEPASHEERLCFIDHDRHYETTIFPVFNSNEEIEWLGTLCFDITEKKEKELQLTQLYEAVESVKSGIVICQYSSPDFPIIYINPAVTTLTGYTSEELIGQSPKVFSSGATDNTALEAINKAINAQRPCTVVLENRRKDGSYFWNEFTLSVITNADGQATHIVGVQNDVSDRIEAANKIERLAFFDSLTNIPNRALFNDRLLQVVSEAKRAEKEAAILYIDLDGFKAANDTFGHDAGDQLLKEASTRMKQCIRDQDSLARMGGDEFTILIPNLAPEEVLINLPKVIERIKEQLGTPFVINEHLIHISACIGISLYPRDGDTAEELLINADHAMYHAKASGKNTFRFFQQDMNHAIEQQQRMESALREAVRSKAFSLYYQPQIDFKTGTITAEALLRCHHPELKDLSPAEYIPIAEQTGLIDEIGIWVIQKACSDLADFVAEESLINKIAINISPMQFRRQNLAGIIERYLNYYQLSAENIEVEVTENLLIDDYSSACTHLNSLRELGITIAIDDFGTGFSSLTYLKQLPIDTIKIDKHFIDGLPTDPDDVHIVKAISGLAQGMGLNLLAEGVETEEQLAFVRDQLDCHVIQGFHISKPLSKQQLQNSQFYSDYTPPAL